MSISAGWFLRRVKKRFIHGNQIHAEAFRPQNERDTNMSLTLQIRDLENPARQLALCEAHRLPKSGDRPGLCRVRVDDIGKYASPFWWEVDPDDPEFGEWHYHATYPPPDDERLDLLAVAAEKLLDYEKGRT